MNIFDELLEPDKKMYSLKNITRFSNMPRLSQESVMEHSYYVAHLCHKFSRHIKLDIAKILLMAMYHDGPEIILGDIISLPKRKYPEFKKSVEEVEEKIVDDYFPELLDILTEYRKQKSIEAKLVKLSDILSVLHYCRHELDLGNSYFDEIYENTKKIYYQKSLEINSLLEKKK